MGTAAATRYGPVTLTMADTWSFSCRSPAARSRPSSLSTARCSCSPFPGGYTWPEFGYTDEEAQEAFQDQLAFLDAYADPATNEVEVKRPLRRARLELRVSNGAVLRGHWWSEGPDPVEP